MSIKKQVGKQTIGQGEKTTVELRDYGMSTQNLNKKMRTTISPGTLIPAFKMICTPGDQIKINISSDVMTKPTNGPLFGKYKLQVDVYKAPLRLYQSMLQNNEIGQGLNMQMVTLPQLILSAKNDYRPAILDSNAHTNPSSIMAYLGKRGVGHSNTLLTGPITREFHASDWLMYWDLYKNFYANKQEEIGVVIHTDKVPINKTISSTSVEYGSATTPPSINVPQWPTITNAVLSLITPGYFKITCGSSPVVQEENVLIYEAGIPYNLKQLFGEVRTIGQDIYCNNPLRAINIQAWDYTSSNNSGVTTPKLVEFPLSNLDDMRRDILVSQTGIVIDETAIAPYGLALEINSDQEAAITQTQEGLAIKTYQSDRNNNWINLAWVAAANNKSFIGTTTGGGFSMDTLNVAQKIYELQNRVLVSGGSIDDWYETVYTARRAKTVTTPEYIGGMSRYVEFQEVVSTVATESAPLGQLAGKGVTRGDIKGGYVETYIDEASYVMAIASLTPIIDYSQGNAWDGDLKTMDDLHKPALDGIGYQDLLTDWMDWRDTEAVNLTQQSKRSAGKQPAWINWTTNVDETYGNFAIETSEMFMTLNRKYEWDGTARATKDITTYIDPSKHNDVFADVSLDAMNFWLQLGFGVTARRKMSNRQIPVM